MMLLDAGATESVNVPDADGEDTTGDTPFPSHPPLPVLLDLLLPFCFLHSLQSL